MAKEVTFRVRLNLDGKNVIKELTVNARELEEALVETKTASDVLRDSLVTYNQGVEALQNVSSNLSQLTGVLNDVTAESRSFGAAMAAANTMAGKGGEDFANLKEQVAELSKQLPIARDELANGLYQVISNGVPEDNWLEYLEKSAKASVGGIADLGETVKVTSTIIKNYGLEWDAAESIQDKIQLTAKNGVTSFEQLAQALPRVTSNAATLGVSIDELMATFSTLTGVSGNTAEVSTQLAAIFTALVKPSSEAAEMAKQMGIQFDAASIKAAGGMEQFLVSLDKSVKQYAASSGMLEQEIYGKLFGSAESLRALGPLTGQLADKFRQNVADMKNSAGTIEEAFGTMASTGAAKLQMLNNKLGELTDMVQGTFGNLLPYLNFGSQLAVTSASVLSLTTSMKSLGVATRIVAASSRSANQARVAAVAVSRVLSAAVRGEAVSATTAAVATRALGAAIKGLLVSTGVGLAVWGLVEAIGYLASGSGKAADGADKLAAAEQRAKQAHEQQAQEIASVRSEMMQNIAQLKDFKGSKEQERTLVQQMNAKYGEALGYYSSVSQWYQALTANSQAYCNQMINEIRLRSLANQAAELQQKQHDLKYNEDGSLRKFSKRNKTKTVVTGQVDAGDGKLIPVRQQVEVEGTSQLAEANKQLTTLYHQERSVRREMEEIATQNHKITIKHTAGYSATAPTAAVPSGKGGGKAGNASTTTSSKQPDPLEGSIDWFNKAIDEKRKQLQASADEATAKALNTELEGLQRQLYMLKVKVGVETPPAIEVKKQVKPMAEQIQEAFDDMQQYLRQHPLEVDVETDEIKKLKASLKDLESLEGLSNIDITSFENVKKALQGIKDISDPTAKGFAIAGASCQALGSAMQQLGSDSAAAKAGLVMAAVGQLALSFAQAMTDASKNWITWLAFGVSGTAQLVSIIGTLSQFATGGIVGGDQKSGDNVLVRVNSGEMILNTAQQARLFALANGTASGTSLYGASAQIAPAITQSRMPDVMASTDRLQGIAIDMGSQQPLDLRFKLRGEDLVASIANTTRSQRKRSNIKI